MICSISGQSAQEPVVSKNGDIFEKRLVVKHIETHGTCPITNEALSVDDLIPIRTSNPNAVKPRQLSDASIPGMLQTFQNEWDALMLETFNLKKQLNTTRQQLSHSLYQNDASCRVIARLLKERDTARKELEQLKSVVSSGNFQSKMEVENTLPGLDAEAKNKLDLKNKELSTVRKLREVGPEVATVEDIKQWTMIYSQTPHKASLPGILCLELHPTNQDLVMTGGVDKTAVVFNRRTAKKDITLVGHTKKVSSVKFHPTSDVLMTGSADSTVKIWSKAGDTHKAHHTIGLHTQEVVGLSLHATNDYLVSASKDKTWAFHNVETGKTLLQVTDVDDSPLTCVMFHPDGLILVTGTEDSLIRVWDIKSLKNVATFRGHKGAIADLKFSENGYYLATSAQDNALKLWDLRGPKNINTMQMDSHVLSLDFDYSGKYLAAAIGREIRTFTSKPPNDHVLTLDEHTSDVTCVKWGKDAQFLVSTSMDRSLKFWSRK
jgi:pre-mRNA-processing factor 19